MVMLLQCFLPIIRWPVLVVFVAIAKQLVKTWRSVIVVASLFTKVRYVCV